MPLTNVLVQRLLNKLSVDSNTPGYIPSIYGDGGRYAIEGANNGVIWGNTKAFQSVKSRGAPSGLNQVVINDLVFQTIGLVDGGSIT